MTKASSQHPARMTIESVSDDDSKERWFDTIITADVVDRQGEVLDPAGFTLKEYRDILQAPIIDTHSNITVGRFKPDSLRYDSVKDPASGKMVNAIVGRGVIFQAPKHKSPEGDSYEQYPVWDEVWEHIKSKFNQGSPSGVSIGGDPDPVQGKQVRCTDGGKCHIFVPKVYWYETSIVRDGKGPANPVAVNSGINAMAKSPARITQDFPGEMSRIHSSLVKSHRIAKSLPALAFNLHLLSAHSASRAHLSKSCSCVFAPITKGIDEPGCQCKRSMGDVQNCPIHPYKPNFDSPVSKSLTRKPSKQPPYTQAGPRGKVPRHKDGSMVLGKESLDAYEYHKKKWTWRFTKGMSNGMAITQPTAEDQRMSLPIGPPDWNMSPEEDGGQVHLPDPSEEMHLGPPGSDNVGGMRPMPHANEVSRSVGIDSQARSSPWGGAGGDVAKDPGMSQADGFIPLTIYQKHLSSLEKRYRATLHQADRASRGGDSSGADELMRQAEEESKQNPHHRAVARGIKSPVVSSFMSHPEAPIPMGAPKPKKPQPGERIARSMKCDCGTVSTKHLKGCPNFGSSIQSSTTKDASGGSFSGGGSAGLMTTGDSGTAFYRTGGKTYTRPRRGKVSKSEVARLVLSHLMKASDSVQPGSSGSSASGLGGRPLFGRTEAEGARTWRMPPVPLEDALQFDEAIREWVNGVGGPMFALQVCSEAMNEEQEQMVGAGRSDMADPPSPFALYLFRLMGAIEAALQPTPADLMAMQMQAQTAGGGEEGDEGDETDEGGSEEGSDEGGSDEEVSPPEQKSMSIYGSRLSSLTKEARPKPVRDSQPKGRGGGVPSSDDLQSIANAGRQPLEAPTPQQDAAWKPMVGRPPAHMNVPDAPAQPLSPMAAAMASMEETHEQDKAKLEGRPEATRDESTFADSAEASDPNESDAPDASGAPDGSGAPDEPGAPGDGGEGDEADTADFNFTEGDPRAPRQGQMAAVAQMREAWDQLNAGTPFDDPDEAFMQDMQRTGGDPRRLANNAVFRQGFIKRFDPFHKDHATFDDRLKALVRCFKLKLGVPGVKEFEMNDHLNSMSMTLNDLVGPSIPGVIPYGMDPDEWEATRLRAESFPRADRTRDRDLALRGIPTRASRGRHELAEDPYEQSMAGVDPNESEALDLINENMKNGVIQEAEFESMFPGDTWDQMDGSQKLKVVRSHLMRKQDWQRKRQEQRRVAEKTKPKPKSDSKPPPRPKPGR